MSDVAALSDKLRRAGASIGTRAGHAVPLHYGSPAGELAVCMRSVGLVDREDLGVLVIESDESTLDRITAQRFEGGLRAGEAATSKQAHWGRLGTTEAVVVGPREALRLLLDPLSELEPDRARAAQSALVAIEVVGPGTPGLLLDLGIYGALDGGGVGRATLATVADQTAVWMLLDDNFALTLVEPARAPAAWESIAAAGRRFGLGYVGAEAAERFDLIRCEPVRPKRVLS